MLFFNSYLVILQILVSLNILAKKLQLIIYFLVILLIPYLVEAAPKTYKHPDVELLVDVVTSSRFWKVFSNDFGSLLLRKSYTRSNLLGLYKHLFLIFYS